MMKNGNLFYDTFEIYFAFLLSQAQHSLLLQLST